MDFYTWLKKEGSVMIEGGYSHEIVAHAAWQACHLGFMKVIRNFSVTDFQDFKTAIENAKTEIEICRVVELCDELYLRDELKMDDSDWAKITDLIAECVGKIREAD